MSALAKISKTATRTCIACGRSSAKHDFVRFVRNKEGVVRCDKSGKSSGRGAYLCAAEECFALAQQKGRLSAALRCKVDTEEYEQLGKQFKEQCVVLTQGS